MYSYLHRDSKATTEHAGHVLYQMLQALKPGSNRVYIQQLAEDMETIIKEEEAFRRMVL